MICHRYARTRTSVLLTRIFRMLAHESDTRIFRMLFIIEKTVSVAMKWQQPAGHYHDEGNLMRACLQLQSAGRQLHQCLNEWCGLSN